MPEETGHPPIGGGEDDGLRPPPPLVLAASRTLRRFLILLVRGYQLALGPYLGGQCRFHPTCSNYAIDALRFKPAWKAIPLIAWRILRCQPLCKPGPDPIILKPRDRFYKI